MDDETTKVMSLPRCGVRDKVGFGESRAKRYALQGKFNHSFYLLVEMELLFHKLIVNIFYINLPVPMLQKKLDKV